MMVESFSRYAICMAVAKRARQITTDALIRGLPLDYNPVELASAELKKNQFCIVSV